MGVRVELGDTLKYEKKTYLYNNLDSRYTMFNSYPLGKDLFFPHNFVWHRCFLEKSLNPCHSETLTYHSSFAFCLESLIRAHFRSSSPIQLDLCKLLLSFFRCIINTSMYVLMYPQGALSLSVV